MRTEDRVESEAAFACTQPKKIAPQQSVCNVHPCKYSNKLPVCLVTELQTVDENATQIEQDGVKIPVCHMVCVNPVPEPSQYTGHYKLCR